MAENTNSGIDAANSRDLHDLQQKFHNYFTNTNNSTLGRGGENEAELDKYRKKLNDIVDNEFSQITSYSGPSFTQFINDALKDPAGNDTNLEKVINDDATSFSTFFYERYKNINNKYEDLRMVVEQLCELSTAVTALRDNVTASDGIMSNVSKTIEIHGLPEEREEELRGMIENIEHKYNLDAKMHDTIIPNTLTYGDFFVFHQPYNRIFSKFELMKKDNPLLYKEAWDPSGITHRSVTTLAAVTESTVNGRKVLQVDDSDIGNDVDTVFEAYSAAIPASDQESRRRLTREGVKRYLLDKFANTEVINDGSMPLMEDAEITSLSDPDILKAMAKYKKRHEKEEKEKTFKDLQDMMTPDSVVNTADIGQSNEVLPQYKDISGIYLKLMSPLRTVPVYVLDECIGYYLLYETYGTIRNNMLQNNQLNRTNLVFQQVRNKDAATSIVDVIATRIIRKIDNKFVKNNPKFRELMVNALMYEDLYKRDFKVQFVSVEYMTHFKVNEDIETHLGVSMLRRSLFYAKLYMTMLMFKVVSTVTRSNDTRVFYIRQSGIDKDVQKQVQRAAREYKENQISYNDVSSVNTLISKAGKAKDMFVATGRSGEKPVDFDIISGQDVPLNTDFVEFLRKNMINGTDVPMVVLEYNDTADFARSIEMGNVKYAVKICSTQKELNIPATAMYRALLHFEHPEIPENELDAIEYKFNRPKSLAVQNDGDTYSNADNAATFLVKVICGDNTEKYNDQVKDQLFRYIMTTYILPGMWDWDDLKEKADQLISKTTQDKKIGKLITPGDNDNDSTY